MRDESRREPSDEREEPQLEQTDLRDLETDERDQDDVRGGTPNYSKLC